MISKQNLKYFLDLIFQAERQSLAYHV